MKGKMIALNIIGGLLLFLGVIGLFLATQIILLAQFVAILVALNSILCGAAVFVIKQAIKKSSIPALKEEK